MTPVYIAVSEFNAKIFVIIVTVENSIFAVKH